MNSVLRSAYNTITVTTCFILLKLIKASSIIGLRLASFNAGAIMMPVLGAHVSSSTLIAVVILRTVLRLIMTMVLSIWNLCYHLPSLAGALYFKTMLKSNTSWHARVCCATVSLTCITLFVIHPIGASASLYSFYWFIPLIIALIPRVPLVAAALGSTFTTHAIGSVIFLYTTPMNGAFWLSLIPVVLVERSLFCAGIIGLYYLKVAFQSFASSTVSTHYIQAH